VTNGERIQIVTKNTAHLRELYSDGKGTDEMVMPKYTATGWKPTIIGSSKKK